MKQQRFDLLETFAFNAPADETIKAWRYLDFTKFISLLNSGSLHLTRYDQFDKVYEGIASQDDEVNARLKHPGSEFSPIDTLALNQLPIREIFRKYHRQYVFINCWHINEAESAGLWKLYAKLNKVIAIQTRFNKLRKSLLANCQIGEINYVDHQAYTKGDDKQLYNIMHKCKSFEHERELRICYVDTYDFFYHLKNPKEFFSVDSTQLVETIPIDIQSVIETVRIAPEAPTWLVNLAKDSLIRFGYDVPVFQSSLREIAYD